MLPVTLALALVLTTVWGGDTFLTISDAARREAGEGEAASFVSTEPESTPEDSTAEAGGSQSDANNSVSGSHREDCTLTTEHIAPDECKTSAELDEQNPDSTQAELDEQAAAQVDALILALDELATGTEPDQSAVLEAYETAQAAFDALTDGAKALVVNANLLADYARVLGGTGEVGEEPPAGDVPNTLEEPAALTAPPADYVRPVTIELAYDDKFEDGLQTFKWDEEHHWEGFYYDAYVLQTDGKNPFDTSKEFLFLRWILDTSKHSIELTKPVEIGFQNEGGSANSKTVMYSIDAGYTIDNTEGIVKIPMKYLNMSNGDYDGISLEFCEKNRSASFIKIKPGSFTSKNSVDLSSYIGVYQTEDGAHTLTIKKDLTVQYDNDKPSSTGIYYDTFKLNQYGDPISATISANSFSINRQFLWNEDAQTLTLVGIGETPVEEDQQLVFNRLPDPVELLANGTKKGYDTLTDAIADAVDGDTIELNADLTENVSIDQAVKLTINGSGHKLTATTGNAITINADGVDLSINQLNIEATQTQTNSNGTVTGLGRGIQVGDNFAASFSLTNCELLVSQQGVSYNGKASGVTLTLDGTTIKNSQISDYEKDVKIGGNFRGISLSDVKESSVILKNHSAIKGFGYCINVGGTEDTDGVIDTQGLVVTVEDSELFGWTGFNVWGSQATYNITRSKILGINTSNGSSNSFAAIVFNDDIYEQFGNTHAVNNVLNITDSTITNYQSGSCTEELLRIDCGITQLNLYGTVKFIDTTGKIAAALYLNYMQDYETFLKNNVHLYGIVDTSRLINDQNGKMPFAPTLLGINTYVNDGKKLQSYVFDFASFIPGIDYAEAAANQEKLILYTDVDASTFAINGDPGQGNEFGGWTLDLNGHKLTVAEWTADKVTVTDSVGGGQIIVGGKPILVAANGNNRYPTIQAAVEAAKDGDTITVNADFILTGPVTIDKSITLKGDGTHKITVDYNEAGKDGKSPFIITKSGVTLEGLNVELTTDTFNIVHFGGQRVNLKYCTFRAASGIAIRKAFNSIGGGSQLTGNTVVSGNKTFTDGSKTGLLSVRTTEPDDLKVGTILIQENTFQGFYKGVSVDNNAVKVPVLVSQNKFVGVDYPFEASAETASCLTLTYNYSDGNLPKLKDATKDTEPVELTGENLPSVYPYYADEALTILKTKNDSSDGQSLTTLADETINEVKDTISNLKPDDVKNSEENKNKVNNAVEDITSLPNNTLTTSAAKDTVAALEELYVAANENVIKTEVTVKDSASTLPDAATKASVTGAALSVPADAVSKIRAELVIEPAEEPQTLPIDKPADAAVIPLEITLNIVKAGDDGEILQEAIQPRAPIVVTLPIPTGVKPDNIVILHYHANSLPATIYPIVDQAKGTMTFTVTKLSTFVVTNYVRKASSSPSSPSYGSGYYDEYLNTTNYWDGMIDSISGIGNGGAIIANAPDYTLVPTRVLQYLKGKNITLTLRLADGSININGAKMGEVHSDWLYYTFEDLKNEFSDAAPDGSVTEPETPTPSVTAPSITYPELGNESPSPEETVVPETPETPNTPQTNGTDQKGEKPGNETKPAESPAALQEASDGISPWAVAAIVAACLVLIGLIVFLVLRFRRRR